MINPQLPSRETHIKIESRRPRAVLDPWLCLQPAGPVLIQRLQPFVELWVVRELWNILDNSQLYQARPEALHAPSDEGPRFEDLSQLQLRMLLDKSLSNHSEVAVRSSDRLDASAQAIANSIRVWERVRLSSDLAGLQLFWAGDSLAESLFPPGTPQRTQSAYERAARLLDRALSPKTPLACGQRDALALATALGGAPILALADTSDTQAPAHYAALQASAALRIEPVPQDALNATEQHLWWSLLCQANAAALLWQGLRVGLLHVHSPWLMDAFCEQDAEEPREPSLEEPSFEELSDTSELEGLWGVTFAYWQAL